VDASTLRILEAERLARRGICVEETKYGLLREKSSVHYLNCGMKTLEHGCFIKFLSYFCNISFT